MTSVQPLDVIFNNATGYEVPHMILAAYMVAGFLVASVYAVGMLRGRRDRYHRVGFLIPFTVAAIATPVQLVVGDTAARAIAKDQPVKFASMEYVQTTQTHAPEWIGGVYHDGKVSLGVEIPGLDSFLVGFSTDTKVTGWDTVAPKRPPALADAAAPGLRRDGRHRHGAARCSARGWPFGLVAPARAAADGLVPARRRGRRRRSRWSRWSAAGS